MLSPIAHVKFHLRKAALAGYAAFMLTPSASFATDVLDISTGLRTLLQMNDKATGSFPVAVVYDASNPESKADAENIKYNIDKGVGVPEGLAVSAYLLSSENSVKLSGARAAFLAKDIDDHKLDAVCNAAGKNGVLTISTNVNCVRANRCVLAVVTRPRVEIYYSPVAAEVSHIRFSPAFMMLVKQI